MIWVCRLLFLPLLLVLLPRYAVRMLRRGGYSRDFHHRFGFVPHPPATQEPRVWLQAVSVAEVQAVEPLARRLAADGAHVILTTTTSTGYALARERLAGTCSIAVFPLDFWPCSARAWRRFAPDAVVLMEGELWPEHLRQAQMRGAAALLVNARLSDRSFRRYRRVRPLAGRLLRRLDAILAASGEDARRFRELGAAAESLHTCGNLKFDVPLEPRLTAPERAELRAELGFAPAQAEAAEPFVLLGSSTWPGEEAMLLQTLEELRTGGMDARLLLVPRHAERRREIAELLRAGRFSWHQRSRQRRAPAGTVVVLADTTGELRLLTQAADLAFVGKSLPPNEGGQTPIEAAALGVPLVYGARMTNFRAVCQTLEADGAVLRAEDGASARKALCRLARDPAKREAMGRAGAAWHARHRGALDACLQAIKARLPQKTAWPR